MENLDQDMPVKPSKKELLILANQKIEQLDKELTQQKSYVEMYRKESNERKSQIEEIHDFLDGLPNVMPKQKDNYYENKVSTRLLSWIASKASF
jgi:hypothetical protein